MVKRMGKIGASILIAALATSAWAAACFDDKSLQTLDFSQEQGALLYVWSPRMVLSAQHAASAQRQAQRLGLRFVSLHDAGVPHAEVQAARQRLLGSGPHTTGSPNRPSSTSSADRTGVAKHAQNLTYRRSAEALGASQPLCAAGLLEHNALRHFPTAFVVQAGDVHRYPIIGAMPEAAWASSITQRLNTVVPAQAVFLASPLLGPAIDRMAGPSAALRAQVFTSERGVQSEAQR